MSCVCQPDTLVRRDESTNIQSNLGISGVDLTAMVVSDSGLANAEPKWWNASPVGCMLIGLQPRGGWQILQRAAQWGNDMWAHCFGVDCQQPTLYAYFACTIRNRLELLASDRFRSPMQGVPEGGDWASLDGFTVKRPTKLIDGSRGGQAFIAEVLAPTSDKHYTIAEQARLQLLSVLLVGAGLTQEDYLPTYIEDVVKKDFDMSPRLGRVFYRLAVGLLCCSLICVAMVIATWWSLLQGNLFGSGLPYVVKLISLANWATGATGLLMLGGNPRVQIFQKRAPQHVIERLKGLRERQSEKTKSEKTQSEKTQSDMAAGNPVEKTSEVVETAREAKSIEGHRSDDSIQPPLASPDAKNQGVEVEPDSKIVSIKFPVAEKRIQSRASDCSLDEMITLHFGSLHGSIFIPDRGYCKIPMSLATRLCSIDIKTVRSTAWYFGVVWFGILLLSSIALQVGGTLAPAFGADIMSLAFLLTTSLARGAGVSGSEEWMIPKWRRRKGATYGATLVGQFSSRAATEEV